MRLAPDLFPETLLSGYCAVLILGDGMRRRELMTLAGGAARFTFARATRKSCVWGRGRAAQGSQAFRRGQAAPLIRLERIRQDLARGLPRKLPRSRRDDPTVFDAQSVLAPASA